MGWNSWYIWENHVTDKIIRDAADAMVSTGMIDHGYMYVNIDDCWAVKPGAPRAELGGEPRDAQGRVNPNRRFPDMKALTDYIHALGLKAGIYTSPGPLTCGGHVGAYQHEEQDVRQFVDWGFDFLKYDWCSYGQLVKSPDRASLEKPYQLIGDILKRQPRDVVLNLCQYGMGDVWEWGKAGRRPELADRRRLRRLVRGHSRRPSSATASTSTPRRSCTSSAGPAAGTTPTTCSWAT